MLWIFVMYHLSLIYRNTTTAESDKIGKIRAYHKERRDILQWLKEDFENASKVFSLQEFKYYKIDKNQIDDWKYCKEEGEKGNEFIKEVDSVKKRHRSQPCCRTWQ